jgi:hypothetical protein
MEYKIFCPWCGRPLIRHVWPDKRVNIGHCECDGITDLRWNTDGLDIQSCIGHAKQAALQAASTAPEPAPCLTCDGTGVVIGSDATGNEPAYRCPDCNPAPEPAPGTKGGGGD